MSHAPRKKKLKLEPLEGRAVPSVAHPAAHVTPAALVRGTHYLVLNGTAHGQVQQEMSNPDIGATLDIQGQGTLTRLGAVQLSGSLHGTGFIASGYASGTITLTNSHGSVSLQLHGPTQPGFTLPVSGTY